MADEEITDAGPATGDGEGTPPESGSQQDLGDAGKKALAEERAARREAEKQRKELEARLKELEPLASEAAKAKEARKTEAEKFAEKLSATEKRAVDAEQKLLRAEVAAAKGLTAAQARRLVGSTKEELEADADDLITSFGNNAEEGGGKKSGRPAPDRLRPGGMPNPKDPTVAERITAAEKAGRWAEARQLKTQQLVEMASNQT